MIFSYSSKKKKENLIKISILNSSIKDTTNILLFYYIIKTEIDKNRFCCESFNFFLFINLFSIENCRKKI